MFKKGFTLIELLVVMTLLGVLIMVVIAAINPVELANRARDTRFGADAATLSSAIDRYYTTQSEFPWVTAGKTIGNESSFGFVSAGDEGVGVCGATCSLDGSLIKNDELKPEFRKRDFIKDSITADNTKLILVGKPSGLAASVYACYIPLSKANRQKACTESKVYTLGISDGSRVEVPSTTCESSSDNWSLAGWFVCLPQ